MYYFPLILAQSNLPSADPITVIVTVVLSTLVALVTLLVQSRFEKKKTDTARESAQMAALYTERESLNREWAALREHQKLQFDEAQESIKRLHAIIQGKDQELAIKEQTIRELREYILGQTHQIAEKYKNDSKG